VKKYSAVIFDLDDTLYPERDYIDSGFKAVCKWASANIGIPEDQGFNELKTLFEDGSRLDTFGAWLRLRQIHDPGIVPDLVQIYRDHTPEIQPFEGVREMLSTLSDRFQLGLLSDGSVERQTRKLVTLGLESYFQAIVFSDEWGKALWKPNPSIYRVMLEKLNCNGEESVYVGDNPLKDFYGAKIAKLYTIRLRLPIGLHANEVPPDETYAPDREVFSHRELLELL
jgi:putative hydrolase of the HAD superfamily